MSTRGIVKAWLRRAAAAPRALPGQAERLFAAAGVTVIVVVAVAVSCPPADAECTDTAG